jgi:hypothetical protein
LHFFFCSGGCSIDGEEESWDFGTGAGFYVDATEEKWKKNYRMYSYVTKEVGWLAVFLNIIELPVLIDNLQCYSHKNSADNLQNIREENKKLKIFLILCFRE